MQNISCRQICLRAKPFEVGNKYSQCLLGFSSGGATGWEGGSRESEVGGRRSEVGGRKPTSTKRPLHLVILGHDRVSRWATTNAFDIVELRNSTEPESLHRPSAHYTSSYSATPEYPGERQRMSLILLNSEAAQSPKAYIDQAPTTPRHTRPRPSIQVSDSECLWYCWTPM